MANINKIKLSGTTYSIQDLNATKTVELTQAEYDALSVKDPNVFYIITDAEAGDLSNYYTKSETDGLLDTKLDVTAYTPTDLSNYYTKSETSGATEISTALESKADTATTYTKTETDNAITAATSTKQDTLVSGTNIKTINNESILGEGNIEIQGGGGKAIEAGRGISITTGETADTVSFNLPISAITGTDIMYGGANNSVSISGGSSSYNNFFGSGNTISVSGLRATSAICNIVLGNKNSVNFKGAEESWQYSLIIGQNNSVSYSTYMGGPSPYNIICGASNTIDKNISNCFVMGNYNKPKKKFNTNIGTNLNTTNDYEFAHAKFNVSSSATTSFGNSGNTLFSVGNGDDNDKRHNAFEIRQNGDIYIADTNDTSTTNYYEKPMIKLQDALGGGGGSSYTAGDGIDITNDVISVTGKVDTSAITTSVTSSSTDSQVPSAKAVYDQLGGLKLVKLTKSEYDSLTTKDNSTLYVIVN